MHLVAGLGRQALQEDPLRARLQGYDSAAAHAKLSLPGACYLQRGEGMPWSASSQSEEGLDIDLRRREERHCTLREQDPLDEVTEDTGAGTSHTLHYEVAASEERIGRAPHPQLRPRERTEVQNELANGAARHVRHFAPVHTGEPRTPAHEVDEQRIPWYDRHPLRQDRSHPQLLAPMEVLTAPDEEPQRSIPEHCAPHDTNAKLRS